MDSARKSAWDAEEADSDLSDNEGSWKRNKRDSARRSAWDPDSDLADNATVWKCNKNDSARRSAWDPDSDLADNATVWKCNKMDSARKSAWDPEEPDSDLVDNATVWKRNKAENSSKTKSDVVIERKSSHVDKKVDIIALLFEKQAREMEKGNNNPFLTRSQSRIQSSNDKFSQCQPSKSQDTKFKQNGFNKEKEIPFKNQYVGEQSLNQNYDRSSKSNGHGLANDLNGLTKQKEEVSRFSQPETSGYGRKHTESDIPYREKIGVDHGRKNDSGPEPKRQYRERIEYGDQGRRNDSEPEPKRQFRERIEYGDQGRRNDSEPEPKRKFRERIEYGDHGRKNDSGPEPKRQYRERIEYGDLRTNQNQTQPRRGGYSNQMRRDRFQNQRHPAYEKPKRDKIHLVCDCDFICDSIQAIGKILTNGSYLGHPVRIVVNYTINHELDQLSIHSDKNVQYRSRSAVKLLTKFTNSENLYQEEGYLNTLKAVPSLELSDITDKVLNCALHIKRLSPPSESTFIMTQHKELVKKAAEFGIDAHDWITFEMWAKGFNRKTMSPSAL